MHVDLATETEEEHLSPSQMHVALQGMTDANLLELKLIARRYAEQRPVSADDLIQQAFVKALSGERKCPRGVPLQAFLAQIMRSIAFNESRKGNFLQYAERLDDDTENDPILLCPDSGPSPESIAITEQYLEEVSKLCEDDEDTWMLLMYIYEGMSPDEICKENKWTKTKYDTTRKNLRRKLNKHFPNGRKT
jgi:DNA-directed RNA polymerase specialized sigma24 family protein